MNWFVNKRRKVPFPSHSGHKCRCGRQATHWVMVRRKSRSGNPSDVTTGPYCEKCADERTAKIY